MSALDALAHRVRPPAGEPEGALVLLHGRGADENDLFPLLDLLDPERRLVGATARGPLRLPPGGAHWYAVRAIGYPDPEHVPPDLRGPHAAGSTTLLAEHGVDHARHGASAASRRAPSCPTPWGSAPGGPRPAGILALSGFMPTVEGFELDLARPLRAAGGDRARRRATR